MGNVTQEMQNAMPTTFDLNSSSLGSSNASTLSSMSSIDVFNSFLNALEKVKIELDDEVTGKFVEKTITNVIYS